MTSDVTETLQRLRTGRVVKSAPVTLTRCAISGRQVVFATDMERDPIQRNHRSGRFYERRELGGLRPYFPEGGVFVDIGANTGNHGLYFAMFLGASRVIPFEPNPLANRLLIENVLLNGLWDAFDLSQLGVGLSDVQGRGFGMEKRERNLGAAKLLPGEGTIETRRGDACLAEISPDFIKIDVECMELDVLNGLSGLFDRCRPPIFVEVETRNEAGFREWADVAGYCVEKVWRQSRLARNYLMVDQARQATTAANAED